MLCNPRSFQSISTGKVLCEKRPQALEDNTGVDGECEWTPHKGPGLIKQNPHLKEVYQICETAEDRSTEVLYCLKKLVTKIRAQLIEDDDFVQGSCSKQFCHSPIVKYSDMQGTLWHHQPTFFPMHNQQFVICDQHTMSILLW